MKFLRIFFWIYVILELVCVVITGREIGIFTLFIEIVVSALIGSALLLNFRFSLMDTLSDFANRKIRAADFVYGNVAKVFGAFLLVIPGILSDILGLIFLLCAYLFLKSKDKDDDVIDVEADSTKEEFGIQYPESQINNYKNMQE